MQFQPVNRHIWVELNEKREEEKSELGSLLPEDYKVPDSPYVVCRVLNSANDCELLVDAGDEIIVERSMISNIEHEGSVYSIVLENYVYGIMIAD